MKPEPTNERLDAPPFTAARICRSCAARFPVAIAIAIVITEKTLVEMQRREERRSNEEEEMRRKRGEILFFFK